MLFYQNYYKIKISRIISKYTIEKYLYQKLYLYIDNTFKQWNLTFNLLRFDK